MSPVALLVFYVVLAIGVSFLCSVLEAVLLSISPSYIATLQAKQHRAGDVLAAFKADIDRPLAAILSLNTVAHTVGASGAGAQALEVFGDGYVAAASAVLTLLILVFSEIIPKTLGATYWKQLAPMAVPVLRVMIVLTLPLVWLSQGITKLMGGSGHHGPAVSREELQVLTDIGSRDGVLDEEESRILRNLFRLNTLEARDVMTPRTVLFGFTEDVTVREAIEDPRTLRFSRIPLHQGDLDKITGYVLKQDVLLSSARDEHDTTMASLKREIPVLDAGANLHSALDLLLERREHLALLVDQYGGTAGVLTMEDIVETLLGLEIVDESDGDVDMQAEARRRWQERARALGLVDEADASAQ